MDIKILDTNFLATRIVDIMESFIWTERYNKEGDFELYFKFTNEMLSAFVPGYYITVPFSDRIMIVETIDIRSDHENGDKLIVSGRSLDSILDRRIILQQILIDNETVQAAIEALLNSNVINGTYPERNFPNFVFTTSSDPLVTAPTIESAQFYSENLYEMIKTLCQQHELGFKLLRNTLNQFDFSLYAGVDRSHLQSTNPYVVFSPKYDNLISSDYFFTQMTKKNYVLVSGDPSAGPGMPEREQVWTDDVGTGLNRREMFSDASDISKYIENTETEIDNTTYHNQLRQRGLEELAANSEVTVFDASVSLVNSYVYNEDFFLGDIIQTEDNYGHGGQARIVGMTFSEDLQGFNIYPTLETQ